MSVPLDEKAKKYLDPKYPVTEFKGMKADDAQDRYTAYQNEEYVKRAGKLAEDLIDFYLHQRQTHSYLDDECIGGIALFCINLRELWGDNQTPEEIAQAKDKPDAAAAQRTARLQIFDRICEQMQHYFDNHKND